VPAGLLDIGSGCRRACLILATGGRPPDGVDGRVSAARVVFCPANRISGRIKLSSTTSLDRALPPGWCTSTALQLKCFVLLPGPGASAVGAPACRPPITRRDTPPCPTLGDSPRVRRPNINIRQPLPVCHSCRSVPVASSRLRHTPACFVCLSPNPATQPQPYNSTFYSPTQQVLSAAGITTRNKP
jgi:hypothetical protein